MQKKHIVFPFLFSAMIVHAQQVLTVKDYQQAESMLTANTDKLIDRTVSAMNWLEGDKLTCKALTPDGAEFYLVDAAKGTRSLAFDHVKLAAALSKETGKNYTATTLPFQAFSFSDDMKPFVFAQAVLLMQQIYKHIP